MPEFVVILRVKPEEFPELMKEMKKFYSGEYKAPEGMRSLLIYMSENGDTFFSITIGPNKAIVEQAYGQSPLFKKAEIVPALQFYPLRRSTIVQLKKSMKEHVVSVWKTIISQ